MASYRYKNLDEMKSAVAGFMCRYATLGILTVKLTRSGGYQCRMNGRICSEKEAAEYVADAQVSA